MRSAIILKVRIFQCVLLTTAATVSRSPAQSIWDASENSESPAAFPPPPQAGNRPPAVTPRIYKAQIAPHWFHHGARFWYRNILPGGASEFIMVDAIAGTRAFAFDHARLAASLSKATGRIFRPDRLPFDSIEWLNDDQAIQFAVDESIWQCNLASYSISPGKLPATARDQPPQETPRPGKSAQTADSPDGKWTALIRDHNLFVRPRQEEKEIQLSTDGKEGLAYGNFSWSPDSMTLAAFRVTPGDKKEVYLVQSSPPGGGRARMKSRPYALPGDRFARYELSLFDLVSRRQIKPSLDPWEQEWQVPKLRWGKAGTSITLEKVDRGHQRFRVIEVDVASGAHRNIIDEKARTFIWTAHAEALNFSAVSWLEKTDEVIYASESNGWRHLYLVDAAAGALKNPITQGDWVVRGIDQIDESKRQVWFRASGVYPGQDPYLVHWGRVNFDGTGLVFLTAADGNHTVTFSPGRTFLVDTYSRVDLPPVSELRRTADGALVCKLEEADAAELNLSLSETPQVFAAKGRDGKTDIWGIICRPRDFDPERKYPVIEDIYAGPQGSFVPKTFSPRPRYSSLTQRGFIVVKIDGMGTAHRSKVFHDVCWHNLKDAGFEDRILWMKAAAKKFPEMDISRVGVYGTSAGGQSAAGAVLFHPEFYKAAIAHCGCHDNRMDKASWNEQWMGYPVGPHYGESSNIENAAKLAGHLFLIVGELDENVPPESTFRFVDALIRANKNFDLLVIPNGGHGSGGAYVARRSEDFFVQHLQGRDAPARKSDPSLNP